jgi:hypothetical protein
VRPEPKPAEEGRGPGPIARLFRDAKKAFTQRNGNLAPVKSRRRKEDTGRGAFAATAKKIVVRRIAWLPRRLYRKAAGKIAGRTTKAPAADTGYLSDILDWLNLWQHGEAFDAGNSGWDLGAESGGGSRDEADIAGAETGGELNYDVPNHLSPSL